MLRHEINRPQCTAGLCHACLTGMSGLWAPCKLLQEAGLPEPTIKPERLKPLGRRAQLGKEAGAQGSAAAAGAPPESCCVWLTGVPVAVGETELVEAFSQFGHPQKVGERPATALTAGLTCGANARGGGAGHSAGVPGTNAVGWRQRGVFDRR